MDKAAAANFLGVTHRTLERYVKDKKIAVIYVGDRPTFDEDELTRFKTQQQQPTYRPAAITKRLNLEIEQAAISEIVSEAIAPYYHIAALQMKKLITIQEAAILSGLPVSYIKFHIREENLMARKIGRRWMMRHRELDSFIAWLWESEWLQEE